jgi:hypothetical protein
MFLLNFRELITLNHGGKSLGGASEVEILLFQSKQADENPDPLLDVVQQYPIEAPRSGKGHGNGVKLVETNRHGDRMAREWDRLLDRAWGSMD